MCIYTHKHIYIYTYIFFFFLFKGIDGILLERGEKFPTLWAQMGMLRKRENAISQPLAVLTQRP